MKSPLLAETSSSKTKFCNFGISLFGVVFCFLFLVILQEENNAPDAEKALGANEALKRRRLLTSYFTFADLPDVLNHTRNHHGPAMRILSPFAQYCNEETPTCNEVCAQRAKGVRVTSSVCRSRRNSVVSQECWEIEMMRCWPEDSNFWDGQVEWTLIAHDLEGTVGIPWIYLRSPQIRVHFFVFGHGNIETYKDAWKKFQNAHSLMKYLIYCGSQAILLSGHSQGAVWAAFTNLYLARRGHPLASRLVMGSGIPLSDTDFYDDYIQFTAPNETSILLTLGLILPGRPVLMDISPIIKSPQYASQALPQYAFICRIIDATRITCVDPQPRNLDEEFDSTWMQRNSHRGNVFDYIHSLQTYRRCFTACLNHFDRNEVGFLPNMKSFILDPPTFSSEYQRLRPGLDKPDVLRRAFTNPMKRL